MHRRAAGHLILLTILAFLLLTTGCTTTPPPASEYNPGPQPGAAWKEIPLTDLAGRGTFTIASFSGKAVLVPVVSVSCATCIPQLNRQIEEAQAAAAQEPGRTEVVVIDLDPAAGPDFLTAYGARPGYTGLSARAPEEMSRDLFNRFGPFAIDTPAIPVILVCPDGRDRLLPSGLKTADDLETSIVRECMA